MSLVEQARKEKRTISNNEHSQLAARIQNFQAGLKLLISYDRVNFPLMYTLVVTFGVYVYFHVACIGRQFLDPKTDLVFPYFTVVEYVFYMGWLRTAEVMINPFGEDDDDFEINTLIDRHVRVAYDLVDTLQQKQPKLVKDALWDVEPELPYTPAAREILEDPLGAGSTGVIRTSPLEAEIEAHDINTDLPSPPSVFNRCRTRVRKFAGRFFPRYRSVDVEQPSSGSKHPQSDTPSSYNTSVTELT